MIRLRLVLACAFAWVLAFPAQAEIYKYVDEKGRVTYSNKPIKGGQKVELPELSTVPAPKVDTSKLTKPEPSERDKRRKELEEQIAKEQKALADAKQAYKEGEEKPEVWRHTRTIVGKDGKPTTITETGRNVAAYEEKMKQLKDAVELHEKNLAKLKAELAGIDAPSLKSEEKQ
jgi:hypothetical protein